MARARKTDPHTSHEAAKRVASSNLKERILILFERHQSMTDEQLITHYNRAMHHEGWPIATESGIRSRRKELVDEGKILDSMTTGLTVSNRSTIIWVLGWGF